MTQLNGSQNKHLSSNSSSNSNSIDKIRISIVDDSEVIREGLKIMLENEPGFDIVGMANDGKAAIELVEAQKPDIVLMDLEMPELNGIDSTEIISEHFSQTKVVVYSDHHENSYVTQSLEAGAKGYFLKKTPVAEIAQGIKNVQKGFYQLGPGLLENYVTHTAELKPQTAPLFLPETELETSLTPAEPPSAMELIEPVAESKPWLKYMAISTLLLIVTLVASAWAIAKFKPDFYGQLMGNGTPPTPITPAPVPTPTAVSALGQIEPKGEVIQLSVSSGAESSKVEQLLVQRGDRVKQGQVVAILDSYNHASAATKKAQTDVRIAQANLERVQAGAKQGDINAQKSSINRLEAELKGQIAAQEAAIARLEAELANANVEYNRYQQLFDDGAISAQERDTRRLRVDTVEQQLAETEETLNRTIETTNVQRNEAQAKLESIAEVRSVDVQVAQAELAQAELAQAELAQAEAEVQQAQETLALTQVRSPTDGQVLKVNVRPGEVVGDQGIVAIGQTEQMYVVAEVYETDVDQVRVGQKALITGSAFDEELEGKVAQVGLEVEQQDVFESDPLVNTDNKVVEVRIRLSPKSSKRVTALSNLQVQVVVVL
jgi:HlyD family secretion protein